MKSALPTIENRGFRMAANVGGVVSAVMAPGGSRGEFIHPRGDVRVVASLCLLLGSVSAAPAQAPLTVETVLQIWKARQEGIRTVWMEFEQVELTKKGSQPLMEMDGSYRTVLFPPEDLRTASQWEFAIEGTKRRYAAKGMFVATQTRQIVPQEQITATEGPLTNFLNTYTDSKDERLIPIGIISAGGADNPQFTNMTLWPCLAAYRPLQFAQLIGFSQENYDIRKNADVIDGVLCTLFSQRAAVTSIGPIRYLMWIDGSRNLMPLRIQAIVVDPRIPEGRLGSQLDIGYEPSSTNGVEPKSWRLQVFADHMDPNKAKSGILLMQAEGTVKRIALNQPIDPASFEVEFPEGAMVSDHSSGRSHNFYALKGGGRREILPAEQAAGLTREKIVNSQPGELVPAVTSKGSASNTMLWGLMALFVVLGGGVALFVVLQRRRNADAPRT